MDGVCSRRGFTVGGLAAALGVFAPLSAEAAVFRALSLESLVRASDHVALVTALASDCHYEEIGASRRIVTDTRVRIERSLGRHAATESEILIRTLGGIVGDRGELVAGEAILPAGEQALLFLRRRAEGHLVVVGMAQGHYPVRADAKSILRLEKSPRLPRLLRSGVRPAAEQLAGVDIDAAHQLIHSVRP